MTKTPGFTGVKCHIKAAFRNCSSGMGVTNMSKTLSSHHYGDEWDYPWRVVLLLRAWTIGGRAPVMLHLFPARSYKQQFIVCDGKTCMILQAKMQSAA